MNRQVVIVGGGLVGLTTAFFAADLGCDVTVIDHGPLGGGAARGNAGYVCPTLCAPLAAPGQLASALKSLRDPTRALRVRPRAIPELVGWFGWFAKASTPRAYRAARLALSRFAMTSPALLDTLATAGVSVERSPEIIQVFHDAKAAEHMLADVKMVAELGLPMPDRVLDGAAVRALVPALTKHVTAAYVIPGDRAIDPRRYVDSLLQVLQSKGVRLVEHAAIDRFDTRQSRITGVLTSAGRFDGDEYVLAAGAGSGRLGRKLGLSLHVVPGQGYNVGLPVSDGLRHPVMFEEVHAVSTPLHDRIRLGGTMEFTGHTTAFDPRRVDAILRSMIPYADLDWTASFEPWAGPRPMSPDGLPAIGRPRRWANLTVGAGHGMFGLTLAPATGKAIADIVTTGAHPEDLTAFDPDRFRLRP